MSLRRRVLSAAALGVASAASAAFAADPLPVATWRFDRTLAADQAGAPALGVIDPLGLSGFVQDTVFGETRWVWRFDGNSTPSQPAGRPAGEQQRPAE